MFSIFINHQIVDKKNLKLDLLFKQAFISAINVCSPGGGGGFAVTLGYLHLLQPAGCD